MSVTNSLPSPRASFSPLRVQRHGAVHCSSRTSVIVQSYDDVDVRNSAGRQTLGIWNNEVTEPLRLPLPGDCQVIDRKHCESCNGKRIFSGNSGTILQTCGSMKSVVRRRDQRDGSNSRRRMVPIVKLKMQRKISLRPRLLGGFDDYDRKAIFDLTLFLSRIAFGVHIGLPTTESHGEQRDPYCDSRLFHKKPHARTAGLLSHLPFWMRGGHLDDRKSGKASKIVALVLTS